MSKKCKECPENKDFKDITKEYNQLVKEHNILVDQHNKITEDAGSLLRFVEDICTGLRVYVTQVIPVNNTFDNHYIEVDENSLWDPGKQFCAEFHNEIFSFLDRMRSGLSAKEVYEEWIKKCIDLYNQNKLGGNQ